MKAIVAVIDWYGPYTSEDARKAPNFDYDDGLYMAIGKTEDQKLCRLQHDGVSTNLHANHRNNHHVIPEDFRNAQIWLGEVSSPLMPGKKMQVTDRLLDLIDWAFGFLLQLHLHDKIKEAPPYRKIIVYNRWWQKDYDTQYKRQPHKDCPDFLRYAGPDYETKVDCFGLKQIALVIVNMVFEFEASYTVHLGLRSKGTFHVQCTCQEEP